MRILVLADPDILSFLGRLFKLLEIHPECYQAPTLPPSLRDYSGKQAFREELGNISTGEM